MARFDYLEPHSLDEALGMLEEHGTRARLVAGSTDFLVRWRTGFWRPETVVCMQHVPGLDGLSFNDDDGLSIGAMVTVQDIEQDAVVRTRYPALAAGAAAFAGVQVRNLATIVGNVCNASPAGDTLPALLAYDAQCRIVGSSGERWVAADRGVHWAGSNRRGSRRDYGRDPAADPAAEYRRPLHQTQSARRNGYIRSGRGLRCEHWLRRDERIGPHRVGRRCTHTDARFRSGGPPGRPGSYRSENIAESARLAAQSSRPIADVRSGAEYRREIAQVLAERTLRHAASTALGGVPDFGDIRRLAVQTAW